MRYGIVLAGVTMLTVATVLTATAQPPSLPAIDTPEGMTAHAVITLDDLPPGYVENGILDVETIESSDAERCRSGVQELDDSLGDSTTGWGNGFLHGAHEEFILVEHQVRVWPGAAAEERLERGASITPTCLRSSVTSLTASNQLAGELVGLEQIEAPLDAQQGRLRSEQVVASMVVAGIEYPWYSVRIYQANRRLLSVLSVHRIATPPDDALLDGLARAVADRLTNVQ